MAYTDTKFEEVIYPQGGTSGGVLTGTGDIAYFPSITQAFRLRRVSVLVVVAITVTSAIISLDYQPTAGSATGRITAWGGTLTITSAAGLQGNVFTTPELNLEISPGGRLVLNQTQAATAGQAMIAVYGDYRWDTVTNFSRITQLAS